MVVKDTIKNIGYLPTKLVSSIPIIPHATATVLDMTSLRWSSASARVEGVATRRHTMYSTNLAAEYTHNTLHTLYKAAHYILHNAPRLALQCCTTIS